MSWMNGCREIDEDRIVVTERPAEGFRTHVSGPPVMAPVEPLCARGPDDDGDEEDLDYVYDDDEDEFDDDLDDDFDDEDDFDDDDEDDLDDDL